MTILKPKLAKEIVKSDYSFNKMIITYEGNIYTIYKHELSERIDSSDSTYKIKFKKANGAFAKARIKNIILKLGDTIQFVDYHEFLLYRCRLNEELLKSFSFNAFIYNSKNFKEVNVQFV